MGRTLPPLFRTVRRVVTILLTRTPCRFLHRVSQNSVKGSACAVCSTDFCGTKSVGLLQISVEVHFWQISAESCGAGSGSHLGYIPPFRMRISFDVLLLASKWGRVALILLTRARCVKQAGAAYTVPIITYGTYQ